MRTILLLLFVCLLPVAGTQAQPYGGVEPFLGLPHRTGNVLSSTVGGIRTWVAVLDSANYDADWDGRVDRAEELTDGTNVSTAAQVKAHLISTANPHATTAVQVGAIPATGGTSSGDIEITNSSKGIILRDSNGNRYRLTVSTTGTLLITAL